MSVLLNQISNTWYYLFDELYDDRTRDHWPGVTSLLTILFAYYYFCTKAGIAWMKNKEPYDLRKVIQAYNVFQIGISFYLFYYGSKAWFNHFSWTCQPVDLRDIPEYQSCINLVQVYTYIKLIDLLDTVFFVLRKKDRQISALHLYHHTGMPICSWLGLKYFPIGHGNLLGVINSFVHTIMYSYYLISSMGPEYQKNLWWKKHVTILQIVQFLIIFCHNLFALCIGCNYPKWINIVLVFASLHFVYMFGKFYYENYVKNNYKDKLSKKL